MASTNYITPGSGSFTDPAGNVYAIDSTGNADENGAPIPNGSGTAAMEYYNNAVYGQDAATGQWYTWNQSTWAAASAPPSSTSAATSGGTGGTTGSGLGNMSVVNGQIVGPNGQPFQARGINIYADQFIGSGAVNTPQDVLNTFPGINFIRLNVFDLSLDTASNLSSIVTQFTNAGVIVEIEDHNYPTVLTGSALTQAATWYASLASAFKSNPNVIFGTQNEPDLSSGWGAVDTEISTIYNAIRGAGDNNLVMMTAAGGYTTSGLNASTYAGMTNVAWDLHYYNWMANNSTSVSANTAALDAEVAGAKATDNIPVVIGEYGVSSGANGAVNDPGGNQVVTAVQQSGLSSAAWAWTSGDPTFPLLLNDPLGNTASGLTAFGQTTQQFIAAGSGAVTGGSGTGGTTGGGGTTTPSPNGTTITSASGAPIVDASGNKWTLVQSATASLGLQIAVNGVVDPITQNVVSLEILNGAIVQENTSGNWYSETTPGSGWTQITAPTQPTKPTPSPSGTTITKATDPAIIDASGNAYTLVQSATASLGLQIAVNGAVDPVTQNVIVLESLNGAIVQENTSDTWYTETAPGAGWTQIANPNLPAVDTPKITVPSSETVQVGGSVAVTGIAVTDPYAALAPGNVTLKVSDTSGTLTIGGQTVAAGATGTLTGSLAQINTDLASLTYKAGAATGSDTIKVDVTNQGGKEAIATTSVTVSPQQISIGANQASVTVNQSYATISATSGNHKVFIYGSHNTIQMSGGTETIQDNGANNTFVLPKVGSGSDVLSGSELSNGDTFDFRTALAATKWDGKSGDLSNYLHVATSSAGNTTVSISTTASGSATQVLVLGGVKESMSQILAHSIT